MLPYSPLHHLLAAACRRPLVCTSGNLSGEPIIKNDSEALTKLAPIADYFLTHNRPIANHVDDSVVRIQSRRQVLIRRARGYAPLPVLSPLSLPPLIAVGGQQKNTIAVCQDNRVIVSQHVGDLESPAGSDLATHLIDGFTRQFHIQPEYVVADFHPGYQSTRIAQSLGLPVISIQHHHAHLAACLLDNNLFGQPVLGVTWDGTGLGTDGTIWGGEFLLAHGGQTDRVGSLRPFSLIGGDHAILTPKLAALSLLYETFEAACFDLEWTQTHFPPQELAIYRQMLLRRRNLVSTTSMGRFFDAFAALCGLQDVASYEGQAAMRLEDIATVSTAPPYPFSLDTKQIILIDWRDAVRQVVADLQNHQNPHLISSRFHRTVLHMLTTVAAAVRCPSIALTGGVFQNTRLLNSAVPALSRQGFRVYTHHQLPPNDGGLSAGQLYAAGIKLCA